MGSRLTYLACLVDLYWQTFFPATTFYVNPRLSHGIILKAILRVPLPEDLCCATVSCTHDHRVETVDWWTFGHRNIPSITKEG